MQRPCHTGRQILGLIWSRKVTRDLVFNHVGHAPDAKRYGWDTTRCRLEHGVWQIILTGGRDEYVR